MSESNRPSGGAVFLFFLAMAFAIVVVRSIYGYVVFDDPMCGFAHCVKVKP